MEEDRNRKTPDEGQRVEEGPESPSKKTRQPVSLGSGGTKVIFNTQKAHKVITLAYDTIRNGNINEEDRTKVKEILRLMHSVIDLVDQTPILLYTIRICDETPIDMILYCPVCFIQHVDAPDPETGWMNPPHRSHKCNNPKCNVIWRPADVNTNGVKGIKTRGQGDS